ncbi:HET-domain-containing protein [Lophiostoma macrostomum CBS 122681]|uniref:HET-domain-containing protein n=1 Tax=Lophiostoma macrostomum CBS 122681 TaxID=1314788 RepID=A0A6A6T4D2_9PLEO|nr:HET-domain-containing protein [Lophiostoma macrostomum CBS 122681]
MVFFSFKRRSHFVYKKLRDPRSKIRLLYLHAGRADEPICCSLRTPSLGSLPQYEAVSYTWGDSTAHHPIQINGKQFDTLRNVYYALKELRHPVGIAILWIDAICIDQQNLEEKRHQILLMGDIYQRASRVIVWLAEPRADLDLAVGLLNELKAQHDEGTYTVRSLLAIHRPRLRSPEWIALRNLLDHPWWSRIWTLQEVVLARNIVVRLGQHVVPWEHLGIMATSSVLASQTLEMLTMRAGEKLHSDRGVPQGCYAIGLIEGMRYRIRNGVPYSLVTLLGESWDRKAADPRDHIFGLSALAPDIKELDLYPNYTTPVGKAFTDTVHKILLRYGTYILFSHAGRGYDR